MFRAAASANAGTSGSTYWGNFDWFTVKNTSGTITQLANSSGSRACGARRACQTARHCVSRASAGTIQGNVATGRMGK